MTFDTLRITPGDLGRVFVAKNETSSTPAYIVNMDATVGYKAFVTMGKVNVFVP